MFNMFVGIKFPAVKQYDKNPINDTPDLISELVDAHKNGKIASVITVESGHSIGTSLGVLRTFQRLGVRALTLTHNCDTPW